MKLLQRYILFELLRVFAFLLSAITVLLVFVGVFRWVSEFGLGPIEVMKILPFIVPSLLPFTIPATLLLTVCVVYGRIAGDQEITAAKAAGINVLSLLMPSFLLGTVATVSSFVLTDQAIPWAIGNIQQVITLAMEDIFLEQLRAKHTVEDAKRGYSISVMDIKGKTLIRPIFQYTPAGSNTVTVQADEATIEFDLEKKQVILHLISVDSSGSGRRFLIKNEDYPFPLPFEAEEPRPRHLTSTQLNERAKMISDELETRRQKRDIATAAALLMGDFDVLSRSDLNWLDFNRKYHMIDLAKLKTEKQSRFALSSSCLFFVLLGGPFAIIQAKRQFLVSFFMCFLPILVIYYPVALLMLNLSKTGVVDPVWAVWIANAIIFTVSIFALRKSLQH